MQKTAQLISLAEKLADKYANDKYDIPLKCKMGLHDWGPWIKQRVRHSSKPGEKQWSHMCDAERRYCKGCGKNSELRNACSGRVTPTWNDQGVDKTVGEFGDFVSSKY